MSDLLNGPPVDRTGASWPSTARECRLDDLRRVVERPPTVATPLAATIADGVPVYEAATLRAAVADPERGRGAVLAELGAVLDRGPGILVLRGAVEVEIVDRASEIFSEIIAEQHRTGVGGGDHYAKPGANDRIWNSLEKLAVADPRVFADYYRSELLALAAEAWLGPGYQMSAQVNVVNPGGEAQRPHRDYHLGFMTEDQAARFPAHAHLLSPALTLQGAVAHGDMDVESGPTKLLPHSQRYGPGFLAWRLPEFVEYFEANHVQLPLASGDALFFSPAVFHAAGTNRSTDVRRMANLLQISSCMGRAMERIDRRRMCLALYPILRSWLADGRPWADIDRVVAATAEAYPFPADLDVDQPVDGLAPPSQADRFRLAIDEGWSLERLASEL
jgi:ectoine hydroxylase-related dioxygenase (phytanoyl-CoA dioxygenase family)